jgi:hypothetical protein
MNQVLGDPRYSPETQQNRADRVRSRRLFMVKVLRMVAAPAADGVDFQGSSSESWVAFGEYIIPKAPPFPPSAGTSLPIYTQLTRGKDQRWGEVVQSWVESGVGREG